MNRKHKLKQISVAANSGSACNACSKFLPAIAIECTYKDFLILIYLTPSNIRLASIVSLLPRNIGKNLLLLRAGIEPGSSRSTSDRSDQPLELKIY